MPEAPDSIGAAPVSACPLCGTSGAMLYEGLSDLIFGAPGEWRLVRCRQAECGLIWLDPQPIPAELPKAYAQYYTHADATPGQLGQRDLARRLYHAVRKAWWQQALGYKLDGYRWWRTFLAPIAYAHPCGTDAITVEAMFLPAPAAPGRVLEVGCGNGYTLERARSLGWEVEGVEFDPACVDLLKRKAIPCHLGDLRDQRLPEASFDAIYTGNVIEHVYDPLEFLAECFRILRPGGRLVLLTPNTRSAGHKRYGRDWRGLEPPRHLQIFHRDNLRAAVERCGFQTTTARTTNRGAYYIVGSSGAIRATRLAGEKRVSTPVSLFSVSGMVQQLTSRLRLWFQPDCGEELLVVAVKP